MSSIPIASDAEWHALRAKHVGGSEVAALFGVHPQITLFELWHRKRGTLPSPDLSDNERVFWGNFLEPAIALGAAKKMSWNIRKVRRYLVHPTVAGMGCSADYEIVAHGRGPGMLSIKNADWLVYRKWEDGEPPLSYELQLQHEMACSGRDWSAMAVLVGGNDLKLYEYPRRPKTIARIEAAVAEFWKSIEEDRPPKPNFEEDGAALARLYSDSVAGKVIDMTGDNRLPQLCEEYLAAAAAEKIADARKDAAKAEMLTKIGDAAKVICGEFTVSAAAIAATPEKTITAEMVGQVVKGRAGYRSLRITEKRIKAA